MQTRLVKLADGRMISFDVADPMAGATQAFFVLGIRKCGSSILNSMLNDLGRLNGYPFVDVGGGFFSANVPEQDWRDDPASLQALAPGYVYGGFRAMPMAFAQSPIYRDARKILLVRDPRDALVSEYFSIAYSHGVPEAQEGSAGGARAEFLALREQALSTRIEAMVVERAGLLRDTFLEYAAAASDRLTKVYRYEDVILAKRPWLQDMADHFGWQAGSLAFIDGMMGWADKVPEQEHSHAFIRRVVPGDHRDKLSPEIIAELDRILAPAMRLFGYV